MTKNVLMPRLLSSSGVALAVLLATSCAYHNPTAPAPPAVSDTAPAFIALSVPGNGTVTAYVQNDHGAPLAGITVSFTSDVGALTPASASTAANGRASSTVTTSSDAHITATVGTLTAHAIVTAPVASPPTITPTPAPPPPPTPAPPAPNVFLNVSSTATTDVALPFGVSGPSTVVLWTWTFGDGVTLQTTTFSASHTYTAAGRYTATVSGAGTSTGSAVITVSDPVVTPPPPPPAPSYTVTLAASPTSVVAGGSSTLTATVTASNGAPTPTNFAWDCDNNGTVEANTAGNTYSLCVFPTAGTTTAKVTVSATGSAAIGSATTPVTVTALAAPVVTVSCNTGVHVGSASSCVVAATRNGIAIPSASIGPVRWDFGDGTTANNVAGNVSPPHTFAAANTYSVVATATLAGIPGTTSGSVNTTILP